MGLDNGGWTLVAIIGSDGETNWSFNQGGWTADTTFYGGQSLTADTRTPALLSAPANDLLFRHSNTGHWASYRGVQSGSGSLVDLISSYPQSTCWNVQQGFALSAGTLTATAGLCDTDLYFNPADQEGTGACSGENGAYGPAWNVGIGGTCPFNDPGANGSLGSQINFPDTESNALGFVKGLGFSGGAVQVYVRRAICGNGAVEGTEECDDGSTGSPNCSPQCQAL